ncbi:dna repair protein rada [Quercus suber]|uniref:Dna repair protein rada n=1 Tax=Quercus suber TaxID=58331 RepID=A0AAW0JKV8_QUESU
MQVSDMRALRLIIYTKTQRLHRLNPSIPNSLSSFPQFSRHFLHSTPSLHHSNSTAEPTPRAWSIYDPAPGTDTPKLPAPTVSKDSNGRDGNGNAKKPNLDIVGNRKKGKARFSWVCADCGHSNGQWWGTCRECNAVGTLKRFSEGGSAEVSEGKTWLSHKAGESRPMRLTDVNRGINQLNWRIPLHGPFGNEVSRVLGGGIVPGSLVLVGGDPGVGKSTLLLQIAAMIAERNDLGQPAPVVYVSGEESVEQIGNRADRLSIGADELFLYSNTEIEDILGKSQPLSPRVIIVDSIQTVYLEGVAGSAGGPAQVKECTSALLRFAKRTNIPILLIGHVTKSGDLAGPHVLEHIVDVVLYMEVVCVDDRINACCQLGVFEMSQSGLQAVSNPSEMFLSDQYSDSEYLAGLAVAVIMDGSRTFLIEVQLGVFEMSQSGLQAVSNPSEMFLSDQYSDSEYLAGLAVAVIMDGSRTFLIEVQALCASGSIASRQVNGIQASRADMIISAIFLNVVSGVKLSETAGDLAVAAAICSRHVFLEFPIPNNIAFIGEVGLGGELRTVPRMEKRVYTVAKLGYKMCIVPKSAEKSLGSQGFEGMEIIGCRNLKEVINTVFRAH